MTQETAASGTEASVPAQRTSEQEPAPGNARAGEPVDSVKPVSFDRLLSVATLTSAQAALVAVRLLDAAQLAGSGNGGPSPRTSLGAVTLTVAGEIDVRPSPPDQGTPVIELLEELLQNARRLPVHPRPEQLSMLRRIEEATSEPLVDPGARARVLEAALADTLGPRAHELVTGQLAALVAAFAHVAPSVPAPVELLLDPAPARAAAPPKGAAARRAAPAGRPTNRPPRRQRVLLHRRNRGRVALIALVVVAMLAVSGYVVLGGPGADIVSSLGGNDAPAAPDTTAPDTPAKEPAKQPKPDRAEAVATLAPRQAGAITGVRLQKAGACQPGALCPVTVTVTFRPATTSRTIGWKVGAAQVCKPGITWSPPVTVTAQPGWTTVYASSSVRVPKGRSLALTALTNAPARAQSRPVPVAGASLQC
jgi:hypothetical protein